MRYVLIAALAVLATGCGQPNGTPYMGPPLVLSTPHFSSPPPPVYPASTMQTYNFPRGSISCSTIGSQTFCN